MKKIFAIIAVAALAIVGCSKPQADPTPTPSGSGLSFDQTEINLYVGDTYTLEVKGLNDGEKVTWESSDKTIATVSTKGKVSAKKVGTATVTVTSKADASRTASVTVKVEEAPAEYVAITALKVSPATLSVKEGESVDLPTATVEPENATDKDNQITWSSENESVVKIENGKVKGIAAGTADIVATIKDSRNNPFTGKCTVTVKSSTIPTTGITVAPASVKIQPSKTAELTVSFEPADHTDNLAVTWKSSNAAVASVPNNASGTSVTVTGVAEGTATITATAGSFTATCEVTVADVELVINMKTVSFPYTWPEADEYTLDQVTMETWINTAGKSGGNESIMGIEGVYLLRTESSQFQLIVGGDKKANEEYEEIKLSTAWTVNEWVHLAATYTKGGKACLYVNGEQKAEADVKDHGIDMNGIKKSSGLRPGEQDSQWGLIPFSFIVGNACDAGRFIQGSIAYTRVWSVARTQQEIAANMYKATPSGNGLIANWYFTEGSGNTIADHSGKGHNLAAKTWTSTKPKAEQDANIEWVEGTLPAVQ